MPKDVSSSTQLHAGAVLGTEMVTRTRDMLLIRHAVTVIIIRPDGVIGVEGTKQYFDGMFDA